MEGGFGKFRRVFALAVRHARNAYGITALAIWRKAHAIGFAIEKHRLRARCHNSGGGLGWCIMGNADASAVVRTGRQQNECYDEKAIHLARFRR